MDNYRDTYPALGATIAFGVSSNNKYCHEIRELMRAIMLLAIRDLQSSGRHRDEALAFFLSEEEDYLFSFTSICRYLGLDEQKAQEIVLMSQEKLKTRRRCRK